jgi:hypothetical protein
VLNLEPVRSVIHKAGWTFIKGPSIYPEKAEVTVTLGDLPTEVDLAANIEIFTAQTGFFLVIQSTSPARAGQLDPSKSQVVEIPLSRIRLNS